MFDWLWSFWVEEHFLFSDESHPKSKNFLVNKLNFLVAQRIKYSDGVEYLTAINMLINMSFNQK